MSKQENEEMEVIGMDEKRAMMLKDYESVTKEVEVTGFDGKTETVIMTVKVYPSAADKAIAKMKETNEAAPCQSGKKSGGK